MDVKVRHVWDESVRSWDHFTTLFSFCRWLWMHSWPDRRLGQWLRTIKTITNYYKFWFNQIILAVPLRCRLSCEEVETVFLEININFCKDCLLRKQVHSYHKKINAPQAQTHNEVIFFQQLIIRSYFLHTEYGFRPITCFSAKFTNYVFTALKPKTKPDCLCRAHSFFGLCFQSEMRRSTRLFHTVCCTADYSCRWTLRFLSWKAQT